MNENRHKQGLLYSKINNEDIKKSIYKAKVSTFRQTIKNLREMSIGH